MIYTLYLVDDNSNITETISLDVVNSFGEDYSSNIAQNTVENGYVISDSISINNPKFSIAGVITDSKFRVTGQLVVFNGETFSKSESSSQSQFVTISDDDYAEKVKDRLIKLWENKEIFGILESTNINNIRGSKVRDIFPCVLSNLGFNKSDAASAIYPTMSIERIRYAVVTTTTVKNPTPELIPKYKESVEAQSKTKSIGAGVSTKDDPVKDAQAQAKSVLEGKTGKPATKPVEVKYDTTTVLNGSYAEAVAEANAKGSTDLKEINRRAKEIFESRRSMLKDSNAVFTPRYK